MSTAANTLAHRIKVSELRAAVGRADWSLVAHSLGEIRDAIDASARR